MQFKVIAFDADDTLWENETFFRDAEKEFCQLMNDYGTEEELMKVLFKIEIDNMSLYGYGIKAFVLSMIEAALQLSNKSVSISIIEKITEIGKKMLNKPVVLLPGVKETLENLSRKGHKLIVVTKGDLLDQERKLKKSKLLKYFSHIEVMSEKHDSNYMNLLKYLNIKPEEFIMIGNSLKSDVIPVLNIGGYGVHIPFHTTWAHEEAEKPENDSRFFELECIGDLGSVVR